MARASRGETNETACAGNRAACARNRLHTAANKLDDLSTRATQDAYREKMNPDSLASQKEAWRLLRNPLAAGSKWSLVIMVGQ